MDGVVLVTGVMAAGKSTVAQRLAEALPRAAHVRGDAFRRMIVSGRAEYVPGEDGDPTTRAGAEHASRAGGEAVAQLRLRYRLSAATADGYAAAGFTAVVQDVVLGEHLRAYVGLVRTRPLYVVVLAPGVAEVAAREAGRAKTGYGGGWTVAALDEELRLRTPRIGLWLDTSGWTPQETVEAILAGAQRARVA
ncbi:phosphotransferase [Streptomyces sp. Ru62]|uniref:AAA family ATPase n=1 Tax=Streptomyces sp. Ru62 TaxID=2080745 RepID=UPI000CDE403B|nr:AAA family ATPase [Streptomyces sp. Ru62]POX64703.1 phosphotransferase [Streptomyces sp. Ru62]